ncbi:MAG: GUN4 domain-containing protein [Stenomitos frigidus ULC029]
MDYRPLRSLLQTQHWEKADRETQEKIAQLLGSFYTVPELKPLLTAWLPRATDIARIPCTDLLTIDRLWTRFSEGRFGITFQRRIVENDSRLSSSEEIKQLCLRRCPQEVSRNIQQVRCKMSCESQRVEAQFERMPSAMGRGRSTAVKPLPAGYYPSPIEVGNHKADAYRELAKRVARCNI